MMMNMQCEELVKIIETSPNENERSSAFLRLIDWGTLEELKKHVWKVRLDYVDPGVDQDAVLTACLCGRLDVLHWLVHDLKRPLNVKDIKGEGPIQLAIGSGNVELLHQLVRPVEQGGFGLKMPSSSSGIYQYPVFVAVLKNQMQVVRELEKPVSEGGFGLSLSVRTSANYTLDQLAINNNCTKETIATLLKPRSLNGFGLPVDNTTLMMHFPEKQARQYKNTVIYCVGNDIHILNTITGREDVFICDEEELGHGGYGTIKVCRNGVQNLVLKVPRLLDGEEYCENEDANEYVVLKKRQIHELKYLLLAYPDEGPYVLQLIRKNSQRYDKGLKKTVNQYFYTYRMIMPLMPGDCIHKAIINITTPLAAAQLVLAVYEELQRLHDLNIIHGDVRPGNIMIEETGNPNRPYKVRFIDFFLACRKGQSAPFFPNENPEFLSVERSRWDVPAGPAQDIFGLACTLDFSFNKNNSSDSIFKAFPPIKKFIDGGKSYSVEKRPDLRASIAELKLRIQQYQIKASLKSLPSQSRYNLFIPDDLMHHPLGVPPVKRQRTGL